MSGEVTPTSSETTSADLGTTIPSKADVKRELLSCKNDYTEVVALLDRYYDRACTEKRGVHGNLEEGVQQTLENVLSATMMWAKAKRDVYGVKPPARLQSRLVAFSKLLSSARDPDENERWNSIGAELGIAQFESLSELSRAFGTRASYHNISEEKARSLWTCAAKKGDPDAMYSLCRSFATVKDEGRWNDEASVLWADAFLVDQQPRGDVGVCPELRSRLLRARGFIGQCLLRERDASSDKRVRGFRMLCEAAELDVACNLDMTLRCAFGTNVPRDPDRADSGLSRMYFAHRDGLNCGLVSPNMISYVRLRVTKLVWADGSFVDEDGISLQAPPEERVLQNQQKVIEILHEELHSARDASSRATESLASDASRSELQFERMLRRCEMCGRDDVKYRCRGCLVARYCSPECLQRGWREGGHRAECPRNYPCRRCARKHARLVPRGAKGSPCEECSSGKTLWKSTSARA